MSDLSPAVEWWTASEIADAAMPGMPATRQGVEQVIKRDNWRAKGPTLARRRSGKGGGWEYSWLLLPEVAKRKLLAPVTPAAPAPIRMGRDEAWAWYETLPQAVKDKAMARLAVIQQVEMLEAVLRCGRHRAVSDVAGQTGAGARTIWAWFALIDGVRVDDRLAYLAPRNRAAPARPRAKDCDPEFFDLILSDYLRLEAPPFADCYRRAVKVAEANGWDILPEHTMRRRLDAQVTTARQVLARKGNDALKRMYPAQVRDKTALVALEAVNADFHKFDVFVRWPAPRGEEPQILRPQMVAFQDIYSGRILAWRMDVTPNSTAVMLCAGDMIETWGIPQHILLDNGREFAAKAITGGAPTRFRFKVKEDDIPGLFTGLGCTIHWATPYAGQSKPIERAFRDMCSSISKDPRLAGAYTGNTPLNKPENYRSRAIDLQDFLTVVAEGIEEHNTRQGRRSEVAWGRSFAEVFNESYARAPIRKATEAQRRLWLLGAEGIRTDRTNGQIRFQDNEFWEPWMAQIAGKRVIIRFDPAALWDGVHVYSANNAYLGHAECRLKAGFFDMDEARVHGRARAAWMKAERAALDAQRRMTAAEVGAMLGDLNPDPAPAVEAKVVRANFGKGKGLPAEAPRPSAPATYSEDVVSEMQSALIADLATRRAAAAPTAEETSRERFRRALELERRLVAGEPITIEQQRMLSVYQNTPEYLSERSMWEGFGDAYFG
jgi:putative transposase